MNVNQLTSVPPSSASVIHFDSKGKEKQESGKKKRLFFLNHCTVEIAEIVRVDAPPPAVRAVNHSTRFSVYVNSPKHLLVEIL